MTEVGIDYFRDEEGDYPGWTKINYVCHNPIKGLKCKNHIWVIGSERLALWNALILCNHWCNNEWFYVVERQHV